jgi:hypothetical protein
MQRNGFKRPQTLQHKPAGRSKFNPTYRNKNRIGTYVTGGKRQFAVAPATRSTCQAPTTS